jgi:hypothetical protein
MDGDSLAGAEVFTEEVSEESDILVLEDAAEGEVEDLEVTTPTYILVGDTDTLHTINL